MSFNFMAIVIICSDFGAQEYWSGLPFPSSGDLLDLGIEPVSLALAGGFFTTESPEKPLTLAFVDVV